MSYTEYGESYTFFTEEEEKLINGWLAERGYTHSRATVCGNCCGFYRDEYWVGGIGGGWKTQKDLDDFVEFAKEHSIPVEIEYGKIAAADEGVSVERPRIKEAKS